MGKTLDQERAEFAWAKTEKANKEFKNLVSGAPSLVMNNGLMQALAFWQERRKQTHHALLVDALTEWLGTRVLQLPSNEARFAQVMAKLQKSDADSYFQATEEALAILRWLRQLAKARVGDN